MKITAAFALMAMLSCLPAAAATGVTDYRIGVEDILDISVWGQAALSKTVPVRPDGKISLPLVNDVVAAGLTPLELREVLTRSFAEFVQRPDVSVVVKEIHSLKVSVMGNVQKPGRYELNGPATVMEVLALAEGFTEFASRRQVTVLRKNGSTTQRIRFDYDKAVSSGAEAGLMVRAGDVVVVP